MIEKHWRSISKAFSWRMVGTLDTIIVSWLVTRRFTVAISIGGIWNRIKAGRRSPDYQI